MGSGKKDKESDDYDGGDEALDRLVELYCPSCKLTRLVMRELKDPLCYCGTHLLTGDRLTAGEMNLDGLESLPQNMGFTNVDELWKWAANQNPKPLRTHSNLRLIRGGGKAEEQRSKKLLELQDGVNEAGTIH